MPPFYFETSDSLKSRVYEWYLEDDMEHASGLDAFNEEEIGLLTDWIVSKLNAVRWYSIQWDGTDNRNKDLLLELNPNLLADLETGHAPVEVAGSWRKPYGVKGTIKIIVAVVWDYAKTAGKVERLRGAEASATQTADSASQTTDDFVQDRMGTQWVSSSVLVGSNITNKRQTSNRIVINTTAPMNVPSAAGSGHDDEFDHLVEELELQETREHELEASKEAAMEDLKLLLASKKARNDKTEATLNKLAAAVNRL